MNFAEIWEEHKKFIVGLGVAALVFLIASSVIGSVYFDKAAQAEARGKKLQARLADMSDPAEGAISEVTRQKRDLEEQLGRIQARLALVRDGDFVLPATGSDADLRYNAVAQRVRDQLVDQAATLDIAIDPTLGLPEFTPNSRVEINGYLAGLSVVERVGRIAVEEGVDSVAPVRIVPGTVARFERGETFVEKVHVEMRLTGVADAVATVLQRIETGDPVIPLGESTLTLGDGGLVTADLLLYAVAVRPDRPVDAGRSRGRRRR